MSFKCSHEHCGLRYGYENVKKNQNPKKNQKAHEKNLSIHKACASHCKTCAYWKEKKSTQPPTLTLDESISTNGFNSDEGTPILASSSNEFQNLQSESLNEVIFYTINSRFDVLEISK
jgi:2-iminoacetate synthase ThiH